MRVCDAALEILRETHNPAVMWGDSGLCHMIAQRAGMRTQDRAWQTEARVLENLARQPGELVPRFTCAMTGRRVRIFYLPEHAPTAAS